MLKIAHFGDIHLLNEINRHPEYRDVFDKIYTELNKIKPDRIVIVGDYFEDKLTLTNEVKILAGEILNNLAKIAKVIITVGNHDLNFKNLSRIDSIETVTKLIDNPDVVYYNKSGIYKDNNVSWVVYHHPEKNIDPWLNQTKDKNQIYIGLYHEEIYGSTNDFGRIFNGPKAKDINYFKNNDYLLAGHIHKRQYFRKNKSAAYPGSTIQQRHGEDLTKHGFLLWNIEDSKNFTVEEFDIPNDHAFIDLYINELTDYDNLNLSAPFFKESEIKIHWKDYSSNITTANEKKIRDYIKTKFNTTKIKFEKIFIYNDVVSSKMLSESLDLTDLKVQTSIFLEYLQEQKYKKEDIEEILKIDEIINNRLHLSNQKMNIEWNIDKFWFSNFKSYGDDNEIDWNDLDDGSVIQISGKNQDGKTTILDAITYILYGKTTTTISPEKFGDNRYINNKRKLDYCLGGAVIDVSGEKFVIQRKTEKVWNKSKTVITSCPTTLDFYLTEDLSEKNKLTGEVRKKTQEKLDLILSDFSTFVRLSYTNADNLNAILSETRSVFMDNVIRDAGLDIFETKLEEFKEYKKELSEEKLIVDIQESENEIVELNISIDSAKIEIKTNLEQIEEFEKELKENNFNRDDFNKKLNKIDSSTFDKDLNLNSIQNYKIKINDSNIQVGVLDIFINNTPSQFDNEKLNKLKIKLKETNDKISERKDEISKMRNLITESDNKKDKVLSKIKELKESEIKKLLLKISDNDLQIEIIKNQKENIVNAEITILISELQKIELEKSDTSNKMKLLQKDGANLKNANDEIEKEIEELKNSTSCPTCGRDYEEGSDHLIHLEEKILQLSTKVEENNNKIQKLLSEYKRLKLHLPVLEFKENEINTKKSNLKDKIFTDELREKLKSIGSTKVLKQENIDIKERMEEIKKDIFDNALILKEHIAKGDALLKSIEKSKNDNLQIIKNIESELRNFNIEGIENDIEIEEKARNNFELRKQKISQKDNLLLSIENFNLKIKELQNELDKYEEYKAKIEENKNIQFSIDRIDEQILILKENIKELNQENIDIEKDILIKEKEIETIQNKITKYLKQKKKDELYKEYMKCVGRDGLPFYLLRKSIHLINKELNELLSNVDFTLFFNENLELKMIADDRPDSEQSAITSSGMERTFCSLALKIALRQINVKSKPSFIFMDELTGKLIGDSVQKFMDFLDNLRNKVKKIVIIEHNNPINFDALIDVEKDQKTLISKLEFKII